MELTKTAEETVEAPKPGSLELLAPDFSALGDPLGLGLPYAMWTIGDQPLLDHWLDYALDEGWKSVCVYTSDRPHRIREHLGNRAHFWPIEFELKTIRGDDEAPEGTISMLGLPSISRDASNGINDSAALLNHWQSLQKAWLDTVLSADQENSKYLALGSGCQVHPSAQIHMPACIGDNVFVGPGCEIGPYAVVESGTVLAGGNFVKDSHISRDTYLGPDTELDGAVLVGKRLLNLRLGAEVELVDAFLADSVASSQSASKASLFTRVEALCVWALISIFNRKLSRKSPDLTQRFSDLKRVLRGEIALYGKRLLDDGNLSALGSELKASCQDYPDGFFSYADAQGVYDAEDPATYLHLAYAASLPPSYRDSVCRRALWKLLLK